MFKIKNDQETDSVEKILTVSVAGYNVEKFIRQNLDSMVDLEIMDLLEVFIVDDGGKDGTLAIAKEYEERYPDTFHAIHKENGGYGSTVNYSLEHAAGKFFRMLDGDDWFDTGGLKKLLKILKETEADIVATQYLTGDEDLRLEGVLRGISPNRIYQIGAFRVSNYIGMWMLCIKTEILRVSGLHHPEHRLYTDQYYCTIPFGTAKTIQYCDFPVYCYRVGREEQSVSNQSRIRHYQEALDNCRELAAFCERCKGSGNYPYILHRVIGYYRSAIRTILLLRYKESKVLFISFENEIKETCPDVFEGLTKSGKFGKMVQIIRSTNYKLMFPLSFLKSEWA